MFSASQNNYDDEFCVKQHCNSKGCVLLQCSARNCNKRIHPECAGVPHGRRFDLDLATFNCYWICDDCKINGFFERNEIIDSKLDKMKSMLDKIERGIKTNTTSLDNTVTHVDDLPNDIVEQTWEYLVKKGLP